MCNDTIDPRVERKIYDVWISMKSRCTNKNHQSWANYGGRGIAVCDEWMKLSSFREWAISNGYAIGLSLDRVNNDGNYTPDNCRFVTQAVQANNTRRNFRVTAFGETKTLAEWSSDPRCCVGYKTVWMRLQAYGMSPEDAMSTTSQREGVVAFGECKSLAEWSRDDRCVVGLKTLCARIRRDHRDPELSITRHSFR